MEKALAPTSSDDTPRSQADVVPQKGGELTFAATCNNGRTEANNRAGAWENEERPFGGRRQK
ncbi:hypothetical protein GCM10016455_32790 [Aliiroseovarius zhejiangensis]|uniref:Uncharacterized protein n=1 Tax=Aliiroseovarius zhejiangensis TaxID=1632025 RepID=A0ABQ3J7Y3_9RHOB|nr:hypothetical protein GCM10016455_32790 [Aliiroseovarius zhejiangensis]